MAQHQPPPQPHRRPPPPRPPPTTPPPPAGISRRDDCTKLRNTDGYPADHCRPRIPTPVPPAAGIIDAITTAGAPTANTVAAQILCSTATDTAIQHALDGPFHAVTTDAGTCLFQRQDGTLRLTIQIGIGDIGRWCRPTSHDEQLTTFAIGNLPGCYATFTSTDIDTHTAQRIGRWYRFGLDPDPTTPLIITANFDSYRPHPIGWVQTRLPARLYPQWDHLIRHLAQYLTRPT
jgi:hypothetical protein